MLAARIKTNANRMSALIDDVLDFARGRLGGGIEVELTEVQNIGAGLTAVIQELQDAEPACKILSSISVSRPVRCDLGRLQQVASNLLANAITHGQNGTPVKFTAHADEEHLILEVWNAGEPIPEDRIGKIFQPFWRPSVSTGRNGLGLGLYICSQMCVLTGAKSPLHRPRRTARCSPRVCHWVRCQKSGKLPRRNCQTRYCDRIDRSLALEIRVGKGSTVDDGHLREFSMSASKLLAILLIVGGGVALAYGGFSYTKETHAADIGDVHLAVHERQRVNIPVWAGLGAVVGGIVLLVTSRKT